MPILLAEDDEKIAKLLLHLLRQDGYQVDHAPDGREALLYTEANVYELIILDWMMPYVSGIDVLRTLRGKHYPAGILMLTAKDTIDDLVQGLEQGADDYLVKPFEYKVLSARIKALLRRSTKKIQSDILTVGNFSIDRATQTISASGEPLNLSRREFQLMSLLLENAGTVIPRDTLIDRVWGLDGEVTQNNLDAFIRLLRKKVESSGGQKVIYNVRGIGYKAEVNHV